MKDSGIEWIGEIPESWDVRKINSVVPIITDFVASGSFADLRENVQYLDEPDYAMLVRTADLSGTRDNTVYISKESYEFLSNSNLFGGEVILSNIGSVGNVFYYEPLYERSSLAPNAIMLNGTPCNKFLYYWFLCPIVNEELKRIGSHAVQLKFNKTQLRQMPMLCPPVETQQSIASYLDRQCAHIDNIIEKTKASIEEYKKLRQAVITQAVTKGVRGDRAMKDSGIEWIGEIPEEWEIVKLKRISIRIGDGLHSTPEYDENGEYYFLNGNNIGSDTLIFKENTDRLNEEEYLKYKPSVLTDNTVLITLNGATFGKTSFYNNEKVLLGKSAGYITLKKEHSRKFIRYYLASIPAKIIMDLSLNGTTIANLSLTTLNNFSTPLPCIEEQIEIAAYLDKKCAEIDRLISKKEQFLTELESYKKSMIYEYVTGKKEVPTA
ncbi:restriction endonuclease subunit S [Ruminococcus flavefaciens]|nr:restriction endonuclease subunit S [Ruminococcus flavefaciens]